MAQLLLLGYLWVGPTVGDRHGFTLHAVPGSLEGRQLKAQLFISVSTLTGRKGSNILYSTSDLQSPFPLSPALTFENPGVITTCVTRVQCLRFLGPNFPV